MQIIKVVINEKERGTDGEGEGSLVIEEDRLWFLRPIIKTLSLFFKLFLISRQSQVNVIFHLLSFAYHSLSLMIVYLFCSFN